MSDTKEEVENLILKATEGEMSLLDAWDRIEKLKERYVDQYNEQSWHTFVGNKFQQAVLSNLKGYFVRLKRKDPNFKNLDILTEGQVKKNDIVGRKLAVQYGDVFLLPDIDMAIVDLNFSDPWNSRVLAIVSCKTSLRERIAQACYWKLKLQSSKTTKRICVLLATRDNDQDFSIVQKRDRYCGKSRNRVIAEYELDGVYVLRRDFKREWEDKKVKNYENIFNDLLRIFKKT